MGRNKSNGLGCFLLDVDLFQDIMIRKLIRRQGGKAVTVYVLLLCLIYRNGYYIGSDKDLPFIISEQTGYDEAYIQEVVKNCLSLGLFSREMYEAHGVLTSEGIQERYREMVYMLSCRRKKAVIDEYCMPVAENALNLSANGAQNPENGAQNRENALNLSTNALNLSANALKKEKEQEKEPSLPPTPPIPKEKEKEKEKEEKNFYQSGKEKFSNPQSLFPSVNTPPAGGVPSTSPPKAPPPRKVFKAPSVDEVREYVRVRGYVVDAERFWNFYESKGWMVGRNKMRNWHAAVATWARAANERPYGTNNHTGGRAVGADDTRAAHNESDADFKARIIRQVASSKPGQGHGKLPF